MGVTKQGKKFRIRHYQDNKTISVGLYKTKRLAQEAYSKFLISDQKPNKYTKTPVGTGRPRKSSFLERMKRMLKLNAKV